MSPSGFSQSSRVFESILISHVSDLSSFPFRAMCFADPLAGFQQFPTLIFTSAPSQSGTSKFRRLAPSSRKANQIVTKGQVSFPSWRLTGT